MRKWLAIWGVCAGLILQPAAAQSPINAFPPGMFDGAALGAAPVAYTGPGDVVSGATFWIGMRGYNTAYSGNALNVCTPSDTTCLDVTIVSGGGLNGTTLTTLGCNNSTTICTIKTWYDQSGATNCGGAACNFTQATIANRATLVVAGGSGCPTASLPCALFNDAVTNRYYAVATAITGAQPFTVSHVARRNSTQIGSYGTILNNSGASVGVYLRSTGPDIDLYIGADHASSTVADNAYHAAQSIGNGASSSIAVDGTTTSFSAAGTALAAKGIGSDSVAGGSVLGGYIVEIGFWGSAFSAGNSTSMNSNQHAYWGF